MTKAAAKKKVRRRKPPEVRRKEIVEIAMAEFSRNGFADTDIQTIADALDIAKGTIYLYYPTKRDLLRAVAKHAMQDLRVRAEAAAKSENGHVNQLKAAVRAHLAFVEEHRGFVEMMAFEHNNLGDIAIKDHLAIRKRMLKEFAGFYNDGVKQGVFRPIAPEAAMQGLISLTQGTVFAHLLQRKRLTAADADAIMDILLCGILSERGRNNA